MDRESRSDREGIVESVLLHWWPRPRSSIRGAKLGVLYSDRKLWFDGERMTGWLNRIPLANVAGCAS